jgi:glycerol-3-phosphate dehydrogenase
MRIAIIGAGKMGVWFAKFFHSKGYDVVVADRKKEKITNLKTMQEILYFNIILPSLQIKPLFFWVLQLFLCPLFKPIVFLDLRYFS